MELEKRYDPFIYIPARPGSSFLKASKFPCVYQEYWKSRLRREEDSQISQIFEPARR